MSSQAAEHRNSAFSNRVRGEEVRPPGLLTRPIPLRYIVLCALIFHVPLLMMRLPENTYDANFHMSMASTYARHWFNPWNEKQLGGFSQTTYPPLTHQWIALLSHFVGLTNAYMIVQGAVILLLPLAVLRFCRLWVDERSASYAAFCSAFIGSLCILVYQDGQIGTTSSTTLFLLALPSLYAFILHGRRSDFTFGVVLACTAAAAHHATLIFGTVFFTAPLVWRAFIEYRERNPGKSLIEPTRRLGIALAMASLGIALVLLPYFISLLKNPIKQTPIPHQSRANFLLQPFWGVHYWVIPFGVFILALPYIFFKGAQRRYLPLFLGFYFAFLFGLGGTTPVPRWILGRAFAVLTFERFTFWALLLALPFAGMLISGLLDRFGTKAAVLVSLLLFSNAALAVATDVFFPLRGPALDVSSVIQFLNSNGHDRYRYLTLGFGSAISKIDCYTNAPTVDGEYNSARTLPEMTQHGAAEFTSAKYFGRAGIASLTAMLRHANHYGLKYIFSRDVYYEPLLTFAGWKKIADLDGGQIQVWTTIGIKPAGRIPSPYETSVWQGIIWGTVPFGFSVLAILMGIHRAYGGSESHRHTGIDEVRISSAPPAEAEGLIKRVALVTAFPPGRGDLSEYGFQLARVLKDSFGLTPLIYADLHSGVDHHPDDELPGYNVTRCWRFNSVASFVTLLSKIRKHRPDVVWFNIGLSTMANQPMPAMAASALPCLCRVLGYNTHVTLHAFSENVDFEHAAVSSPALYRFGARLATRLLLRSDGVHLMLPSYREQMLKTFGSRRQNIFVHPHGIFGYGPEDETPAQRTPGAVLAFGSWGTYKRLECLMEALPTIRRSLPAAQLWVAGGDHPKARRYLEDCAARYRDVPGVHFLGYVAEEHVAGLFRRASVAVLPYNSSAGSSGVVHLACEHQVPIVAADIPDLRELAEFENLHLAFFPANDPQALASELLRVLADDSIGKSLTEHNLRSVSKLTLREIVADYLRTFAHTASRGLSSHDRVQTENTHSEVAASGL